MPPPGHTATTETAAGHDRQVIDTAITSKREAIRLMRADHNITGAYANRLYRQYLVEAEAAERDDFEFYDWLLRQPPVPLARRKAPKHEWRVTSR